MLPSISSRALDLILKTNPRVTSLHSRRLEVVGEKENGLARGRHARGNGTSPLACLLLERPFFLVPTTPKRLLRKLSSYD